MGLTTTIAIVPDNATETLNQQQIKKRIKHAHQVVIESIVDLLNQVSPEIGELMKANITDDNDGLGIKSLTALVYLINRTTDLSKLDDKERIQVLKLMSAFYVIENLTDDISTITFNDGEVIFHYKEILEDFYNILIDLIDGKVTCEEAMNKIGRIDISNLPVDIFPQLPREFQTKQGIQLIFTLNVIAISNILDYLNNAASIVEADEAGLHTLARNGLKARYTSSLELMSNPTINFEEAMRIGKESILVDFHIPMSLIPAEELSAQELEALPRIRDHASMIHRILNEGGLAVMKPHTASKVLADKHTLADITTPSELQLLARILKDVKEEEFSAIVHAQPTNQNGSTPELVRVNQNIRTQNVLLVKELTGLAREIDHLGDTYLTRSVVEFILFELRMYSLTVNEGGEYVNTSKALLNEIIVELSKGQHPRSLIDKILSEIEVLE